jgi:hypothetical protein
MSNREGPKLRLVSKDDLADVLEEVDDDFYAGEGPAPEVKRRLQLKRSKVKFAMVPLRWLMNRRMDNVFPARTRLYLYLQFKSHRGTQEVKLTNKETNQLGLTKQYKMRCLRQLVANGLVSVVSIDNETVRVSVSRYRAKTK